MVASPLRPLAKAALIALMALGSLVLWIGSPLGWLWIASQIQGKQGAGLGPYMIVIVGILVTAVALAKGLSLLNRAYGAISGQDEPVRIVLPWHRSLRGEDEGRPPRTVLDVVMVVSVAIGAVILTVWFFLFAGSPLPSS